MNRILQPWAEEIALAHKVIGYKGIRIEGVHYLCGIDPVWVGLHGHRAFQGTRSSATTAHFSHSATSRDRSSTIVLPERPDWVTVVHELGHALHEQQGWRGSPSPVTEYAEIDRFEAFAEAFTSWVVGEQAGEWAERYGRLMAWRREPERFFVGARS